jgi:hypothetical protein
MEVVVECHNGECGVRAAEYVGGKLWRTGGKGR